MRLIDADELKKDIMSYKTMPEIRKAICEVIDDAPTVKPQKIVTIPPELIEKLASCVVNTIEKIDWDKAIEAYKERPQGEWQYMSGGYYKCNKCPCYSLYKTNYCSNCGAQMYGGEAHD